MGATRAKDKDISRGLFIVVLILYCTEELWGRRVRVVLVKSTTWSLASFRSGSNLVGMGYGPGTSS